MDKDPRVITERDRIRNLPWVQQARSEYLGGVLLDLSDTQTNFARGRELLNYIDRSAQSSLPQSQSILIVGIGMYANLLLGSLGPQKVAAHLQARGRNCQLTFIDPLHEVIEDVRNRRTLYVKPTIRHKEEITTEWEKYLSDTGQDGRIVHELEAGLQIDGPKLVEEMLLEDGIWAADVPQEFHTGIETGRIRLLENDIARADLRGSQPFDFVEMRNVLYLLTQQGQQLAFANTAGQMREGGKLFVNDLKKNGVPVLSQNDGWLTSERLHDLHLIEGEVSQGDDSIDFILTKI